MHLAATVTTLPFIGQVDLNGGILIVFIICFLGVLGFEMVNGFHDTANAVATVIYTKTLKPHFAIVWSGLWNFIGVFVMGTAVAMTLLKVIPLDKLIGLPTAVGACLVGAILLASIIWNLGTWYVGLPLSSTHTLIGAMVGAALAFTYYYGGSVNWEQVLQIGLSLLISPVIGFLAAAGLIAVEKRFIKSERFFHAPEGDDDHPPLPIRILLVTTCTLVSFFHGSNDGQKGVGFMMLVLIAFLPATFALNNHVSTPSVIQALTKTEQTLQKAGASATPSGSDIQKLNQLISQTKAQVSRKDANTGTEKMKFRMQVQKVTKALKKLIGAKEIKANEPLKKELEADNKQISNVTDYAPIWVVAAISLALGCGTMIGWKRIVETIGEKIGKDHLNYAEGATAEIVAAATIGLSSGLGLPVSTTHVLSSGVAGAMRAYGGDKKLNHTTLKNIAWAWVLTVPAAIILAFLLFLLFHLFV
jgi:PiT family inorganic phosphate transporter